MENLLEKLRFTKSQIGDVRSTLNNIIEEVENINMEMDLSVLTKDELLDELLLRYNIDTAVNKWKLEEFLENLDKL